MKYFNYQLNKPMGKVWSLFSGLANMSDEDRFDKGEGFRCEYGHSLEIINSAINGSYLLNNEGDFDLKSYEMKCQMNDNVAKAKEREMYLAIIEETGDEDSRPKYGEISENVLKSMEEAFEAFEQDEDFEKNLSELLNIRSKYIVEEGVDIKEMLESSLEGVPEAIERIKSLSKHDSNLRDLISSLCIDNGLKYRLQALA